MKQNDILGKPFNGSIDDLLNFTQANADFVEKVVVNDENVLIDRETAIGMIKEELNYTVSDEEAERMFDEIMLEHTRETIQDLVAKGLVEVKEYDTHGEPLYGLTEQGNKYADGLKSIKKA